jgi:hypothetical protein
MEFVRSLPAPRPECNFGPREQVENVPEGSRVLFSTIGFRHTQILAAMIEVARYFPQSLQENDMR